MFDVGGISKDRTRLKGLVLPSEPSEDLAYFCGLLAGDGHIAIRETKSDYSIFCAGNPADEKAFYDDIVCPLISRLFNIKVEARDYQKTFGVLIRSIPLVKYLTEILLLPRGRKYDKLCIPYWIKSDDALVIAYIRGLADTDFSLCLKRRHKQEQYYPVITGCSESKMFMDEIACELEKRGFKVSRHYDYEYADNRLKSGFYTHQRIHIYGHTQLANWMKIVGFFNPKHINKVVRWYDRNRTSNRTKVIQALEDLKEKWGLEAPYSEGWI